MICLLFATNLPRAGENNGNNGEQYPGKPAHDTIRLTDINVFTLDFTAFHGNILEAIQPLNGQMDIGPVDGAPGVSVVFDKNGVIESLTINMRAAIMETDKEFVMGKYVIASTPEAPDILSVRMMKNFGAPKENFEGNYDFQRLERLNRWLASFDLKAFVEAKFPGKDQALAYYEFSSDNLTQDDLSNPDIMKTWLRMAANGVKPAGPEGFRPDVPGYYTIRSFNENHEAGGRIVIILDD